MIDVIASIRVKNGFRDEFVQKFKANLPAVLAEEGCIDYYPATDVESKLGIQKKDPDVVTVVEKWENIEALQAHAEAPHMTSFRETVKEIVEDISITVVTRA
tara:strand:- start:7213 stop:7518 length:306 start_codon:yes stop_codon:yes gene_type:complete